jgi:hypothetical protein
MLVLDSDYQNAIQTLRFNWDAFPLTYLATWGSSVTFGSAIQDVTFEETLILDVINTDDAKIIDIVSNVNENLIVSEFVAGRIESTVDEAELESDVSVGSEIESDITSTEVVETVDETQI